MHEAQLPPQEPENEKLKPTSSKLDVFKKISKWLGSGITNLNNALKLASLMDQYYQGNKTFGEVVEKGAELANTNALSEQKIATKTLNYTEPEIIKDVKVADNKEKDDVYSDIVMPTASELADYPITNEFTRLLDKTWNKPTFDQEIKKTDKVVIPDGVTEIGAGGFAKVFLDKKNNLVYRITNWDFIKERGTEVGVSMVNHANRDLLYKVMVGQRDTTGLTPRILEYDDSGTIVMEYIEGVPLNKFTGKVPEEIVNAFFAKLADFHKLGLYHGDLSTLSHYVIQPDGNIRLIDHQYMISTDTEKGLAEIQQTDTATAKAMLKQFM